MLHAGLSEFVDARKKLLSKISAIFLSLVRPPNFFLLVLIYHLMGGFRSYPIAIYYSFLLHFVSTLDPGIDKH